ncbi:SDH family Clp fold serine proteinase [Chryseolinea lacunae]|uniref:Serine protease n=1 Tax=Chryseolinea lacunae TaxID=2801331 RepID=A0ABS1KKS0_9BACT|nr:hypothetical protein [Chryseolinea lacunae]MBL0739924.1 hypothetical protein [Chryseolinea lacunae]
MSSQEQQPAPVPTLENSSVSSAQVRESVSASAENPIVRFRSTQDWYTFLHSNPTPEVDGDRLREFRSRCYAEIEALRGRPLIVYAARFLDQTQLPSSIALDDIEGFTDLVNAIPAAHESIDVLLHSPGGDPNATERIVGILRNRFREVHFIIPHSAYSAATMLALSGNEITLHSSATLGPIDPQLDGIPARSIINGFENAKQKIQLEGPETLPAYVPLLQKLDLHLLEICEDADKLSKQLVTTWLTNYMFAGKQDVETVRITEIVEYFSSYDDHMTHSRPLHYGKIAQLGVMINQPTGRLRDLIWETFILINIFFGNTGFYKLYENNYGISWGRQQVLQP